MKAVIFGSTGLVGRSLLRILLEHPGCERVATFVRRPSGVTHPKLDERVIDFARLADHAPSLQGDHLYCCLGTTRKLAGSREAQRAVDRDLPVEIASIAKARGVRKFLMVSSVGADPRSASFYLRLKGEAEEAIGRLGFEETHFFRPSFLVGPRTGERSSEARVMRALMSVRGAFAGPLRKYRPIAAESVARAMADAAAEPPAGTGPRIVVHDSLELLARGQ